MPRLLPARRDEPTRDVEKVVFGLRIPEGKRRGFMRFGRDVRNAEPVAPDEGAISQYLGGRSDGRAHARDRDRKNGNNDG
jgi:hypothetical protein